jgi:hypothetical protein
VTLPQAAAADVTVTLSSTDTNTLTISPLTVTIPAYRRQTRHRNHQCLGARLHLEFRPRTGERDRQFPA